MKHLKTILAVSTLAIATTFAFGYTTTDANSKEFVPKTSEEKAWKAYVDDEVTKKKFEAYTDAFKAFGIEQNEYTYYDIHAPSTSYKEVTGKDAALLKVSILEIVKKDVKSGDIIPGIFIKKDGTKAFMVFKSSATGENHIYWFAPAPKAKGSVQSKSDGTQQNAWTLDEAESASGKKLEKLKLKPLKDFTETENN
ncbi:hypothetical protein [Brevibacillus migulae]|uniref:hypothetical protein n=1 Tax=Brevibacillus migulae TaxID=1644114 RepID=UPI00106EC96A|nr:hypothetical protein [Brevibacillus migulae]